MTNADLLGDFVVYVLRCGTLLAVGLALPRLLRMGDPRVRLAYWRVLLPVVVVLPLADVPPGLLPASGGGLAGLRFAPGPIVVTAAGGGVWDVPVTWIVAVLLGAGCCVAAARLATGLVGLARLARKARPLATPLGFLPSLEARVEASAALRVSAGATSPSTFGWRRPVVLLPEAFEQMPAGEQEAVLCHELLHVRRRDWLVTVVEELVRACLWFHPAVGALLARTALAREQVVDQEVVRLTGARRTYLEALLRIASIPARRSPFPVPALCRGSQLVKRVALLTQEVSMTRTRIVSSLVTAAVALAATGALGAAALSPAAPPATPLPTTASSPQAPAAEAPAAEPAPVRLSELQARSKGKLVEPKLVSRVNPEYPEEARKAGLMGKVVVEAEVTTEGAVRNARVLESTDAVFESPTLAAVAKWKYAPATVSGKPVAVIFTITTQFRLQ